MCCAIAEADGPYLVRRESTATTTARMGTGSSYLQSTSPLCQELQRRGAPLSVTQGIPYDYFYSVQGNSSITIRGTTDFLGAASLTLERFWIHWALMILSLAFIVVTFLFQLKKPARYGRHDKNHGKCYVPQRLAHAASDFIPGVVFFTLIYFLQGRNFSQPPNVVFYCLFTVHYLHRGLVTPLVARYSSWRIPVFIPLVNFIANLLFHYLIVDFISSACYFPGYLYDPRFLLGLLLFIAGFVLNKMADTYLVCLRCRPDEQRRDKTDIIGLCLNKSGGKGCCPASVDDKEGAECDNGGLYTVPECCLFKLIVNPNYLGEAIQWFGWALATWSLSGFVWWMFSLATFIPRARHNLRWYRKNFDNFPKYRRGLIPGIF